MSVDLSPAARSAQPAAEQPSGGPSGGPSAELSVDRYRERIGLAGPLVPTLDTLREVCRAHTLAVPFETLDGPDGVRPPIDYPSIYDKVVRRRCGGACMELNALLGYFLDRCGFEVTMLAGQAWRPHERRYTQVVDHMLLRVGLDGGDWLVDVAFLHNTFVEPLRLGCDEQYQRGWRFRLYEDGDYHVVTRTGRSRQQTPLYRFRRTPYSLADFDRIVDYYLDSGAESAVADSVLCARGTPTGKLTLVNDKLIVASGGREMVTTVGDAEQCARALDRVLAGHPHLAERALRAWRRRY